jgi:hypothetical protein
MMSRPYVQIDPVRFCELAATGAKFPSIAKQMDVNVTTLKRRMQKTESMYSAWRHAKPERTRIAHERRRAIGPARTRAWRIATGRMVKPIAKPSPIPFELMPIASLALAAVEARQKRIQDAEAINEADETLLAACRLRVDSCGGVCLGEIADELDWRTSFAFDVARRLADRGRFPFLVKARESIDEDDLPTVDESEITATIESVKARSIAEYSQQLRWLDSDGINHFTRDGNVRDTIIRHIHRYDGKPWEEAKAVRSLARSHGWVKRKVRRVESTAQAA